MSDAIDKAAAQINTRLGGGFDGRAKFVVEHEGSIVVDPSGARPSDAQTDVTLTADIDTFRQIMDGALDPTMAFMQGRLKIDGDMGTAIKLGQALG